MQFERILAYVPVGVAIVAYDDWRIRYVNSYLHALLSERWRQQEVAGRRVEEVVPADIYEEVFPLLEQVARTGQGIQRSDVPYEGFLAERGRTYWRVSLELASSSTHLSTESEAGRMLLVTIEDTTNEARARLHLKAIHHISEAIAGAFSLPHVLDRILEAVQEMVGSTRCAVLLLDYTPPDSFELEVRRHSLGYEGSRQKATGSRRTASIAAQKGVHLQSQDWHPVVDDEVLLGRVVRERRSLMVTDTRETPELELPLLDDDGVPRRPGSVLCVPIFEPHSNSRNGERNSKHTGRLETVLGSIEVYHRRTRGFPAEEVELLEQFAQQAGLAIQNARLFRSIDSLARAANRSAHQRENVMQAMPDGVIIYDHRWRVAEINHAARKLLGWDEEVHGLTIIKAMARSKATFHDPTLLPRTLAEFERRALAEQVDEYKMQGADGQECTVRCSYTPIRDDEGDIFAFVVIYHDVSEQAAARERIEAEVIARTAELAQRNAALQEAQTAQEIERQRLKLLLERLPSGVLLIGAEDYSIHVINRRAIQLLRSMGAPLPSDEMQHMLGQNYALLTRDISFYTPSNALMTEDERPVERALKQGEATEAELHVVGPDGQVLYLLVSAAPLRALDGTITDAVLVLHNVTRTRTLERAREDFFTTMAHELKTPLANIRAHLSALLARDLEWTAEQQRDYLQTADEQVERLVRMVNQFLDASRVEAGALRLELEPILLPEMVEDLQDRLEALITSSKRQLDIHVSPDLPAVRADYELIMSVLTNLLSNAFRYAPEGGRIVLEAEALVAAGEHQPSGVTLRVIDWGPGLSEEQQKNLFTRFSTFAALSRPAVDRPGQPMPERRRATSSWSPATGLGLYISQGIVEAHGSTLTLKSSPGQGATFAFTLPVAGR